jgi:hypothetical protein
MVVNMPLPSAFRRRPTGRSSHSTRDLRVQNSHNLQQIDNVRAKYLAPVKRKRASLCTYSSSSDTDSDEEIAQSKQTPLTRRHTKRVRHACEGIDDGDVIGPLGSTLWDDVDALGGEYSKRPDEPFFDFENDDELTVEYARSAEPLGEVDLGDIYGESLGFCIVVNVLKATSIDVGCGDTPHDGDNDSQESSSSEDEESPADSLHRSG